MDELLSEHIRSSLSPQLDCTLLILIIYHLLIKYTVTD